jgi:hypothetical protein
MKREEPYRIEWNVWSISSGKNGGESLADRVNEIDKNSRETAVEVRFIKEILVQNMGNISSPQATKTTTL